jgi:beta-glucosidase
MKNISYKYSSTLLLLLVFTFIQFDLNAQKDKTPIYLDTKQPINKRLDDLISRMTLEEKLGQMCQYVGIEHQKEAAKSRGKIAANNDALAFYKGISEDSLKKMVIKGDIGSFLHVVTAKEANEMQTLAMKSRLKIPLIIGIDAIHGNAMVSGTTVFPTPLSMSSSWNLDLVEKISVATAKEMRATGSHWTFTPNIDIARDARWGRVGETFGEDTYLVTKMGVATVKGLQGKDFSGSENVISCIKHLIGGGESFNGTNAAPTDISERSLHEFHLPPYKAGVEAGAFTVMTAHNELNGVPCHAHEYLMTDLLRKKWGFNGFYVSDWMDIERLNTLHHMVGSQKEAVYETVKAGMDMHMHGPDFLEPLAALVREGRISEQRVNESARRILEAKFKLGLFENPYADENLAKKVVSSKEHQDLSLELARQSIILLKNDNNALPIAPSVKKILVTGPNADNQTILGDWALLQPDENVTTIYEGIKAEAPAGTTVDYFSTGGSVKNIGADTVRQAAEKAKDYDMIVVAVGENSLRYLNSEKTSGENIDRDNINLIGRQNDLIRDLIKSGKPVVVVLVSSRPLSTGDVTKNAAAVIEAWEPGGQGGEALAEILFGKVNPSGKLTISIPHNVGQIRTFYNYKPSSYFHPYIMAPKGALYDFGYGLSYTKFKYSNLQLSKKTIMNGETVTATVKITNEGDRDGDEIAQLYINDVVSLVVRPVKELKAFKRVSLKKGETQTVSFELDPSVFKNFQMDMSYKIDAGDFKIMVGGSSRDKDLQNTVLTIK